MTPVVRAVVTFATLCLLAGCPSDPPRNPAADGGTACVDGGWCLQGGFVAAGVQSLTGGAWELRGVVAWHAHVRGDAGAWELEGWLR